MTVESPPEDSTYLYLLERDGRIYRFLNDSATSSRSVVADLRSLFSGTTQEGQSGLMDMAFHPDGQLLITVSRDGATMVWDLRREIRSPLIIAAIVERESPWQLKQGRLMPKP